MALFQATLHLYNGSSETGMTKGPLYHLQLAHIDSLLNFLLLVRAKRMIKQAQSPFDQVCSTLIKRALLLIYISGNTSCLSLFTAYTCIYLYSWISDLNWSCLAASKSFQFHLDKAEESANWRHQWSTRMETQGCSCIARWTWRRVYKKPWWSNLS